MRATAMYPFGNGWKRAAPFVGLLLGMALYLAFALGPSLSTVVFSFTNVSGIPDTPWKWVGFDNYSEFLTGPAARDNWAALERTLEFCVAVTLIQNAIGLLVAVTLNRRLCGHLVVRGLVFMPAILGYTVNGLMWVIVFNPVNGPIEWLLNTFGTNSSFFGSYSAAFPLIIAAQIWSALGVSTIIFLAGLQSIPRELYEAAQVDGAHSWSSFRFITWPLLAPTVTANVLLAAIGSLQTFQLNYVISNGQFNTSVLGLLVFQAGFASSALGQGPGGSSTATLRQGYATALSMLQFLLVLIIALVLQAYLRRREHVQ